MALRLLPLFGTLGAASLRGESATSWEVVRLVDKAKPAVNDSAFQFELRKNGEPFLLKGVCYSPLEIAQNFGDMRVDPVTFRGATTFGDLFWDDPRPASRIGSMIWALPMCLVLIWCWPRKKVHLVRASEPFLAADMSDKAPDRQQHRLGACVTVVTLVLVLGGLGLCLLQFGVFNAITHSVMPSQSWYALWGDGPVSILERGRGDLATIANRLNANAIRVYSMQSRVYETERAAVKAPQACAKRTHQSFLDEAHKQGLYVLVGIPVPLQLFHKTDFENAPKDQVAWWEFVINETAAELGSHPATVGFTIMNELDDEPNAFPGQGLKPQPDNVTDFFYSQTVKYARWVKAVAPGKLVSWALHDVPQFVGFASKAYPSATTEQLRTDATYYAQIAEVFDYFGVNTYHSDFFHNLLGGWGDAGEIGAGGMAYGAPSLSPHAKPVLLTEIGWPATSRTNLSGVLRPSDPLLDNEETQGKAADLMEKMLSQVFDRYKGMAIGQFYFEYADEWWKTPPQLAGQPHLASSFHHDGGSVCDNIAFPNWCNDEESFGLFSRARGEGRKANSSDASIAGLPVLPVDKLIPRTPMIDVLARLYVSSKP
jgi:hypothetical protein